MAVTTPSDTDLVRLARAGDETALTELYLRHRAAALRLARSYGPRSDADDLVSGAFERVMAAIRRGGGPEHAFRPYLYVTIRRLAMAQVGRSHHVTLEDIPESVVAVADLATIDPHDREMIVEAFSGLPDRWQAVLWQTAVEGRRPGDVARAVGLPANTVSVVAHRARERLRETYLQAHVRTQGAHPCDPHRSRLGAYVRRGLSRRHRRAVDEHLAGCDSCSRLVDELDDVNRLLARAMLPVFALSSGGPPAPAVGAGAAGSGASATGAGLATGSGPASGPASLGSGAGLGAGTAGVAAKVATGVAVGVIALAAALVPHYRGSHGDDGPTVQAGGPVPSVAPGSRREPAPAAPAPSAAPLPAAAPGGTTGTTIAGPPVSIDVGLAVGGPGQAGPVAGIDLGVELGGTSGVSLDVGWTAALLGAGTLDVAVANPGSDQLVDVEVVVDLSSGAWVTSLLGSGCEPPAGALLDVVVGLLRTVTCELGNGGAHLVLPLQAAGAGETATVVVRSGGGVLDSAIVPLTPAR